MAMSDLITLGIGPGGDITSLLTGGLALGVVIADMPGRVTPSNSQIGAITSSNALRGSAAASNAIHGTITAGDTDNP